MQIRNATSEDEPFLRKMMNEAAAWNPDWPHDQILDALSDPIFARYHDGWGRPSDTGVIAEEASEPMGAAWYRLFTADAPGYGFVDERTPELGIAVARAHRRKGVGAALLRALIERARADGMPSLSLSVAPHNRSRMLYQREGFEKVGENGDSWTMCLAL